MKRLLALITLGAVLHADDILLAVTRIENEEALRTALTAPAI